MPKKRKAPQRHASISSLLRAGKIRLPCGPQKRRNPQTLTPEDRKALQRAQSLSREFHGKSEVIELSPAERKRPPRFVAVAGKLQEFTYSPPRGSARGTQPYEHESGDRGIFAKKAKQKPFLAVDPITRRPVIVAAKSPMRFDPRAGFKG